MQKILRKLMKILLIMLCSFLGICILWFGYHKIRCVYEKDKYASPYDTVIVDSKEMSLKIQGSGNHTIVLLPGLGTAAPILDFQPLADLLAKENKVVIVEPFGYGWSDLTESPRTVENEVLELREALKQADIDGPYILMPHSISGLDAIYYANTYPDEIEGIIGIDCTLPRMHWTKAEEIAERVSEFLD